MKLTNQCSSVVIRFLKPTRYTRWMTSHISQAMKPESRNGPTLATALNRLMVAIEPLSK